MGAERDPIEELLASVSDGRPIDWDAAARNLGPDGRTRLHALRDVARIADYNRSLQQAPGDDATPDRWGDLLVLESIGAGAHGEVFRTWDPALRREVALKLLPADGDDARLLEEGRAAARIRHPHVAAVHGIDRHDDRVGLWMELVRGSNLEQEVRTRGRLSADEVARVGREIGSALVAVHAAGLLHRDVKPANIVRDAEGRHVLTDFGLGMSQAAAAREIAGSAGTPMYMAPELLAGGTPTERSDVYGLGLVLWYALAGRHPFAAESIPALVQGASRGPELSLAAERPDVPRPLLAIVTRAIAPDPAARFADARSFCAAFEAVATTERETQSSQRVLRGFAIAALAAVVIGVAILVPVLRARRPAPGASVATVAPPAPTALYAVDASFLRFATNGPTRLASGDRVRPGDRLGLEFRATRPAWVYVLDEDERGERYLLFPQPLFDTPNPLVADSTYRLPGPIGGRENAWTVTSRGGREYLMIVASPEPVPELEAELGRL
ncbi:MAG: serine/threonine-protein kinase, partial [Candidatus Eisenbacteria bacterium]